MIPTVVIPVLNRYDLLARCVASIDFPVENLLIINNGPQAVVVEKRAANQRVLDMPSNLGVGPSWNLGIKCFPWSSGWLFLNSDAWFSPNALADFWSRCGRDTITLAGDPGWCCAWIGDEVVKKVGMFSECYLPAYYEDTDFEARAKAVGIIADRTDCAVNHDNASTVLTDPAIKPLHMPRFRINTKLHNERWANDVPDAGHWSLDARRKMGWDAPQ
jgi:GT2 family glycosyltransferase